MTHVLITGVGGLVGSESALYFAERHHPIIGIDNDGRGAYFGTSIKPRLAALQKQLGDSLSLYEWDIRQRQQMNYIFEHYGESISLIVHCAAQPSHDFAAKDPALDFGVNAIGTTNLLEAAHKHCPHAVFIYMSTNKVYGDRPNHLAYEELETRYEPISPDYQAGINEQMSIDQCLHSLFGASKAAADLIVQEYGRYFGMKTACFRGGCLTGAGHVGAELHGFLAYLARCLREDRPYTVYGYEGKQVRDNLHARDLARAFDMFWQNPKSGAVYNIGGGRRNSLSVLEAIDLCQRVSGKTLDYQISDQARIGDHQWWITDNRKFQHDYPSWDVRIGLVQIAQEMFCQDDY